MFYLFYYVYIYIYIYVDALATLCYTANKANLRERGNENKVWKIHRE